MGRLQGAVRERARGEDDQSAHGGDGGSASARRDQRPRRTSSATRPTSSTASAKDGGQDGVHEGGRTPGASRSRTRTSGDRSSTRSSTPGKGEIRLTWVKGHSGDPMNELVDRLAVEAARLQRGAHAGLSRARDHLLAGAVPDNLQPDAICRSGWRKGVGHRPGRLAVRVEGMGLRLPLRRARRGRHRPSRPRSGHEPHRHRRDLRLRPLGADRRPGNRGAAGRRCSSPRRSSRSCPLRAVVARRAAGSARRLGVAQMDLYQLHWPNPVVPLTEQMAAMRALQRSGADPPHRGEQLTPSSGGRRPRAPSVARSCPTRSGSISSTAARSKAMTDWAAANDRVVIAYSPLAQGLLSARYDAEHRPTAMRAQIGCLPAREPRPRPALARALCARSPPAMTPRRPRSPWPG